MSPLSADAANPPLLKVRGLEVAFRSRRQVVHAVRGANLELRAGHTIAIVGESGSGKSTTAHAIIGLLPGTGRVTGGSILFKGRELVGLRKRDYVALRGSEIGLVPQDPMSNLNPVYRIGAQIREALKANGIDVSRSSYNALVDLVGHGIEDTPDGRLYLSRHGYHSLLEELEQRGAVKPDQEGAFKTALKVGFSTRMEVQAYLQDLGVADADRLARMYVTGSNMNERVAGLLSEAGLPDAARRARQYPHEFSGGMRQRALIAMALAARPDLLIADEPTSALDVTVQRQILDHLGTLTRELGTAVLFITHDLGLAAERAERLVVMYKGRVVEAGPSLEVLTEPRHAYTRRLIDAAPSLSSRRIQLGRQESFASGGAVQVDDAGRTGGAAAAAAAGEPVGIAEATSAKADVSVPAGGPASAAPAQAATAKVDVSVPTGGPASGALTFEEATAGHAVVLETHDLTRRFRIRGSRPGAYTEFLAVDGVSLKVARGTTAALVGESGSGKSTVANMILSLLAPSSGTILFNGVDEATLTKRERFEFRRRVQPVFQDPYGSLDPMFSIYRIIEEPLRVHHYGNRAKREARVREVLDAVALPAGMMRRYPNELSGGQRQRVAVARALALGPELMVLDEAVSALDVLVQAQVLDLLARLQRDMGLTYFFITHDLAVVRQIADWVFVMEKGRIVEEGTTDRVFDAPAQPYTKALLDAIPGGSLNLF
ncbi:MAG: ABC transporter ATP-binding protein [Bifidobacteriaceae bacterium]|jgi:peptide/nickel transport system ATP-binding protein|nr:ABC transporter ATP-binding protein [Bifidobacteriaceae bacterium]